MEWLTGILGVVLVDLVLSGDNALVIGMACAGLPREQRRAGIFYGSLTAIFMRISLAAGAAVLMRIPLLQAGGGLLLLWLAYRLSRGGGESGHAVTPAHGLWEAVRTIALADLVMSLDNVLAVSGVARENLFLLLFGLGLTIPIIIWGSALVARLMAWAPWLVQAGAAVLAWTAGVMIAGDPAVALAWKLRFLPPMACAAVLGVSAIDRALRPSGPR